MKRVLNQLINPLKGSFVKKAILVFFTFSFSVSFANDCATATAITCGTSTVTGSTVGDTPSGTPTCVTGSATGGADWYTFVGDGATWTAETVAPTDYDTQIWVFSGSCGTLTCVTGNDDVDFDVLSRVNFATTIGVTYYVIIGGFDADEGNYSMDITSTCPSDCNLATTITCGTSTITGSTVGGTPSGTPTCVAGSGTGGADWYTFVGDGATWTAETVAPTDYDTQIWVFSGSCGTLTCVTGNDDVDFDVLSRVNFATTIGVTYYVIIGGFDADEGNYSMDITSTCPVIPGPGGISNNLQLWLKANTGVTGTTDVSAWADQSISGNDATQGTSTRQPTKTINAANYNPALTFNGTSDFLDVPYTSELNSNDFTVFSIHKVSGGSDYRSPFTSRHDNGSTHGYIAYVSPGGEYEFWNGQNTAGWQNLSTGTSNSGGYEVLEVSAEQSGGSIIKNVYLNSSSIGGPNTHSFSANTSQPFRVGAGATESAAGNYYWNGDIAEQVVFSSTLSSLEKEQVISYLCAKYGITKPGDYLASDGTTTIWDDVDAGYNNNLIGIGRDDLSAFSQKQSQTSDDTTRIFISTLAADNQANVGTMANDRSFIMIGDNGGNMKGKLNEKPAGIYTRLNREWKVTNTNFNEDFSVELKTFAPNGEITLSDLRLLVDDDGDFSNATIYNAPDVTFSFGSIIISGIGTNEIPLNTTRFITLASVSTSTPLPVQLLSFETTVDKGHVVVNWTTTTETNNDFFSIERSVDAVNWSLLTNIKGAGTSSSLINYTTLDENSLQGTSYYRLKQTDFDGKFSYSKLNVVTIDASIIELKIYPNPTENQITVEGPSFEIRTLSVYDVLGEDVTEKVLTLEKGEFKTILDFSNLGSGVYLIKTGSKKNKIVKY